MRGFGLLVGVVGQFAQPAPAYLMLADGACNCLRFIAGCYRGISDLLFNVLGMFHEEFLH